MSKFVNEHGNLIESINLQKVTHEDRFRLINYFAAAAEIIMDKNHSGQLNNEVGIMINAMGLVSSCKNGRFEILEIVALQTVNEIIKQIAAK